MEKKENLIVNRSFDFALRIIVLYKIMIAKNEYVLSKQMLRSGTSIGANIEEAVSAHSTKDFISRMIIALKEARETRYWLRLIDKSKLIHEEISSYISESEDIIHILTAIINTTKQKLSEPKLSGANF
jgi:four helix bundle protein